MHKKMRIIFFRNCIKSRTLPIALVDGQLKKMPPRGLPLGGLSSIFNSQPDGFEPVYSTYQASRLLGAGRQTLGYFGSHP